MEVDQTKPVLVTGATGYVAGSLVQKLLEAGMRVHAPVRDAKNHEKLAYLNAIADKSSGSIHYFEADLLKEGSYDEAMQGCELVYHTASPFSLHVDDPQTQLVEPALIGTSNVLGSVERQSSVKRVVLTSSCAAIYSDNTDLEKTKNGILTEDDWNTESSLTHSPYFYSKTLAEKEAWKIAKAQARWDLVVINPSLVIGPGINPYATSESFEIVKQMGDGTLKAGIPKMGLGAVDVRDVAEAHFQAGFTPEAHGRYLTSGHNTDMLELAQTLLPKYGKDYPIPKKSLPKWLVWAVGPMMDKSVTRKIISRNVNKSWQADNSKVKKELGVTFRPLSESMNAFFEQLIDASLI
ncbi:MAG: NAD-dependent epimerase/dehydratase family protein [Cellvibrionales bacterium]|nr:NAD-dependent epimerase/dehydratase family protein [Cellvibrionales bacterium]